MSRIYAQARCGTMQLQAPQSKAWQRHAAEQQIAYQKAAGTPSNKITGTERVIPVVVHLIQQSPLAVISDARVQSQIDVLNEDFRKMNADTSSIPQEFQGVAANCEIRFCLATIDPNGCPTTGINRVVAPSLAIHGIDDEQALKSFVQWDPHKYLNMWVPVNLKDNLLGYATFPTWLAFAPQNDGVVINGNNFGRGFGTPTSAYSSGRTATHEVGHWLGLYHTFEGSCSGMSASNCMSQGDEVCDTPPTNTEVYGCPGVRNSCHEVPVDHNDQTMNYMDYTDDLCMYMFSAGQKARIIFFLDNERSQLCSPANLTATGCDGTVSAGCQPIAAFVASANNVCAGIPIAFEDRSFGPATSWDWTFQGGNPATSTLQNPTVSWAQPGVYAVTLRVSNGIGSDTLIQNTFVTIATPSSAPFSEGFEGLTTLPLEWYATDEDQQGSWQISTQAGSTGQQSIVADNFHAAPAHTRDDLVSHVVDLHGTPAMLYFDHAYKRRGSFVVDSLEVWVSTDCGNAWQRVWQKWGANLATAGGYGTTGTFVPTASQWHTDTVDLTAFSNAQAMRIRFRSIGGNSQAIYLDDINLVSLVDLDSPVPAAIGPSIYPNPSVQAPSIALRLGQATRIKARLCTVVGVEVFVWPEEMRQVGRQFLEIPEDVWGMLPAGVYFLIVEDTAQRYVSKLVKPAK